MTSGDGQGDLRSGGVRVAPAPASRPMSTPRPALHPMPAHPNPVAAGTAFCLTVEVLEGIDPLSGSESEAVPNALAVLLFGVQDVEGQAPLGTFAILDAAKVTGLAEMLETSGLEHVCLFRGAAIEEYGDVAPWLVKLEPDNSFTRYLFSKGDTAWEMWDREVGIFLRSRATIEQVRAHFRRFIKLRDATGKMLYFRFWEPATAAVHFDFIGETPFMTDRWFNSQGAPSVEAVMVLRAHGVMRTYRPAPELGPVLRRPFELTDAELDRLLQARRRDMAGAIARKINPHVPDKSAEQMTAIVLNVMARFLPYGFRQKGSLMRLTWWEIHRGTGFENEIEPVLREKLLNPSRDEDLRIADMTQALEQGAAR